MNDWSEISAYDIGCTLKCAKICLDPKLKFFNDCFRYNIQMSDIDGAVERNGQILFLEWKRPGVHLSNGQFRLYKALTKNSPRHKTLVVWGDPQHMTVERVAVIANGKWVDEGEACDACALKERIGRWFNRADMFKAAAA